jgi:hypothetical protein
MQAQLMKEGNDVVTSENENDEGLSPDEMKEAVIEVLSIHRNLRTDQEIAEKIAELTGTKAVTPSTISRLRKKMKERGNDFFRKEGGFYVLMENGVLQNKIEALKTSFDDFTVAKPDFKEVSKVYVLKTRPDYNILLAKKISEVFSGSFRNRGNKNR